MSLRKLASETSEPSPAPKFHTSPAQSWKAMSMVRPRSRVISSYLVLPGDLWSVEGSPPARWLTTSVVRFMLLTLLIAATYAPFHLTRNLKFLYGSRRVGFAGNIAMMDLLLRSLPCGVVCGGPLALVDHLLDLNDDKLRRIKRRKADGDVENALGDGVVRVVLAVALHEVGLLLAAAGECALEKQALHKGGNAQANRPPERFGVGLEDCPLRTLVEA